MKNSSLVLALAIGLSVPLGVLHSGARADIFVDDEDLGEPSSANIKAIKKRQAAQRKAGARQTSPHKEAPPQKKGPQLPPGSLTGTVTNEAKVPVANATTLLLGGAFLDLQEYSTENGYDPGDFRTRGVFGDAERGQSRGSTDLNMGGLYSFKNLRPGVYNVLVEAGKIVVPGQPRDEAYRPQRIVGVVIKPGQETVLDITLHPGKALEQVGAPKGNSAAGLKQYAWIEGTVTTPEGLPVWNARTLLMSGALMTLKKSTGEQAPLQADHLAGGFFSAAGLTPGTYDLVIEKGRRGDQTRTVTYRPLIASRIVLKPGVRTILNLVMHPGGGLERVQAPPVSRQPLQVAGR